MALNRAGSGVRAIYVTGDVEINARLADLEQSIVKGMFSMVARDVAKKLLPKIVNAAPEGETGELKKSIKIRALKRSRKQARVGVEITTGEGFFKGKTFYGGFVELGTKRMAPQRFIRDEVDVFAVEANQMFEDGVTALLNAKNENWGTA